MTSLSDGLGPQKDPNSGRTRVESGPAGPHRPTTRRGSGIAQPSVPRARCPECLARRGCGPARAIVTPDARHARRAAGDRGPWVSLPLRATIPEGNTVGQHADVDVGPSHLKKCPWLFKKGNTTGRHRQKRSQVRLRMENL